MRYRPPTQLHASLYMRGKKSGGISKAGGEGKTGKPVSKKKSDRTKK